MGAFERFWEKESLLKKTIVIEDSLYERLKELADKNYQTSVNQLINGCIEELIKTQKVEIYPKDQGELSEKHSLLIRESLYEGLEEMHKKYSLSICRLLNIAIKNAIVEVEEQDHK